MTPPISQTTIWKREPIASRSKYFPKSRRGRTPYKLRDFFPTKQLLMFLLIAGLGLSQSMGSIKPAYATITSIRIQGFVFSPQNMTIQNGDTVSWTNNDPVIYTLWFTNSSDGSTYLLSPPTNPGATWTHTFPSKANLTYYDFDRLSIAGHLNVVPILGADFGPAYSSSLAVTFSGSASGGTGPYKFFWSFGDGTSTTGAQASHSYPSFQIYNVTLTVTDSSTPNAFSVTLIHNVLVSPTIGGGRAPLRK